MAFSEPDINEVKRQLSKLCSRIDDNLYTNLLASMCTPQNAILESKTAKIYFMRQLGKNTLNPWAIATYLTSLDQMNLASDFETFASQFNFIKEDKIPYKVNENPKIALMQLLKHLEAQLSEDELVVLSYSEPITFDNIFSDMLEKEQLTPSLEALKQQLKDEDRDDLAEFVSFHSCVICNLDFVSFSRTVRLCLDTMSVDIFALLTDLREALSKQYTLFQSSISKQFSLENDFIPLTFTSEVDRRTEPVTEGSDAELQTLITIANSQQRRKIQYIDAHTEIYSSSLNGQLISLIGHPGTGKTLFCKKLMYEFVNQINNAYRFILLISCRNPSWHALEEQNSTIAEESILKLFLKKLIPTFANSEELTEIIVRTGGNGLLLVIDSFDEFPQHLQFGSTLLYRIMKREVLSKCTVLITSRPGAWNLLLRGYASDFVINSSWQLLGFSPDQRKRYIKSVLSTEKAAICHDFLSVRPELDLLSLVPVNINLITSLVDSAVSLTHIKTLTDMYTSLVVFTLDSELRRTHKSSVGIRRLHNLPDDMKRIFNILAEMSYTGLIARKITFPADEINQEVLNSPYTVGLGLFHIIQVETRYHTIVDYLSFPHLTFQEFLSAWYLSHKSPQELVSIIKKAFSDGTWPAIKVCIRFLCGILIQGHTDIISIIIDNLDTKSAMIDCNNLLVDWGANALHYDYFLLYATITSTHLSILPYIIETNNKSILTSYSQQLCSDQHSTVPHFYLTNDNHHITPVDMYCLSEYYSQLPQNNPVSVLKVFLYSINEMEIQFIQKFFSSIPVNTLLVSFYSYNYKLEEYVKQDLTTYLLIIIHELQQLHIAESKRTKLVEELHKSIDPNYINISTLRYLLHSINLVISSFILQSDKSDYDFLFYFMDIIHNLPSTQQPKQILVQYFYVNFLQSAVANEFIRTLHSNITCVEIFYCTFTPKFVTSLVSSLPKLKYLSIDDMLSTIRPIFNQTTIEESVFNNFKSLNLKGLHFKAVTLPNEPILYKYLQDQTTLEEIHLQGTTSSTLDTLHAIQHMSSLKYIHIKAKDSAINAIDSLSPNSEESNSAFLKILHNNQKTLSCIYFSSYTSFFKAMYNDILLLIPNCSNLQYICFSKCHLTIEHMQLVSTVMNQLHKLAYIDLYVNEITDEGLSKLCSLLNTNQCIRIIFLSECNLTSSSVSVIKSIIQKCVSLRFISLLENHFNENDNEVLEKFTKLRNIMLYI